MKNFRKKKFGADDADGLIFLLQKVGHILKVFSDISTLKICDLFRTAKNWISQSERQF